MKTHHWIALVLTVIAVGTLLLWPRTPGMPVVTDELTGSWRAQGTSADEFQWFMEYTFNTDGTYFLKTGTDYGEEGAYRITNRYLDGSIEVKKTYSEGKKVYAMVILTTDDPNILYLEGVKLTRIIE